MEKILIISYYFPPCNLTAANRIEGWAKYLSSKGYFPIIITRNWDLPINTPEDILKSTGNQVVHKKKDSFEVYYLPYQSSLRDLVFQKKDNVFFKFLSKFLTLTQLFTQNFFYKSIPFCNLYTFSLKLLNSNKNIKKLIISGNPFEQFYFGYLLNKKLGIKWVADYRDGWTTQIWLEKMNPLFRLLKGIEQNREKKWVGTASYVTSVSLNYCQEISNFTKVPAKLVANGYFEEDFKSEEIPYKDFSLAYSGMIYDAQDLEGLVKGIKAFVEKVKPISLKVHFIGISFNQKQLLRFQQITQGYEDYFCTTSRIERKAAIKILKKSHLLIMMAYGSQKGIPSSKLYEYIALQKPVLLYPSDNDIIESTLNDCGVGEIARTPDEIADIINSHYLTYINGKGRVTIENKDKINKYSRKHQTEALANILDSL